MFNFLLQGRVGDMMAPIQSPEAQLLIAIQNRQPDKVRELLEVQGVGANSANDRGVRPMHVACQSGDMTLVRRLLELGADIITPDNAGNTPLHYASKGGHTEMVRMLVGQGAGVEKRNGARLTAYDVAKDHVIRQFLLPLQLKAEAGNPDYGGHNIGITSDAPRDYEQYGVPGMGQSPAPRGQPYGHHNPSSAGPDAMSAALGALMQAPSMPAARPGTVPPSAYPGDFAGTPPRHPGSFSPPDGGGVGYAVPSTALPTPLAMGTSSPAAPTAPVAPLPTQASSTAPPRPSLFPGATATTTATAAAPTAPVFAPPPVAFGSAAPTAEGGVATSPPRARGVAPPMGSSPKPMRSSPKPMGSSPKPKTAVDRSPPEVGGQSFPGVAVHVQSAAVTGVSPAVSPRATAMGTGRANAMAEQAAAELFPVEDNSKAAAADDVIVGTDEGGQASSPLPRAGARAGVQPSFSGVPVHVQQGQEETSAESLGPGVALSPRATQLGAGSTMTSIDLSSSFQAQVAVTGTEGSFSGSGSGPPCHLPPPSHPASAPSSGQGRKAPPPSRPPGAYTPGPGPHQPAGEQPGKFKPIKADGFHSSASDKALQLRYGHTNIVRDFGAPPTAAQLGGPRGGLGGGAASYGAGAPPMGGAPLARPPMAGPPNNSGYASAQAPPQYAAVPQAGHYGQSFGGVGRPQQQSFGGQQPFGQPPQPRPGAIQQVAMHSYPPPPSDLNGGASGGGGFAYPPVARGAAPPPAASPREGGASGGTRGGGGFSVFNPTTDKVVAADSTSSAVL